MREQEMLDRERLATKRIGNFRESWRSMWALSPGRGREDDDGYSDTTLWIATEDDVDETEREAFEFHQRSCSAAHTNSLVVGGIETLPVKRKGKARARSFEKQRRLQQEWDAREQQAAAIRIQKLLVAKRTGK